jgi:hypothetical protein
LNYENGDIMSEENCEAELRKKKKISKEDKFHDSSNPKLIGEPVCFHDENIDKDGDPLAHKSPPSSINKEAAPRTPGITKKHRQR